MELVQKKEIRHHRVGELIREELSILIAREVKDPRIKNITIMEVLVKDDLRRAEIRVCRSLIGEFQEPTAEEIRAMMKGLKSATPYFFEQLKRRLSLRMIPNLHFRYDDSIAKSSKTWSLIMKTRRESEQGASA